MTLFIQDYETEDVMFQTEDFNVVPNKGECLMLKGEWYEVVERVFSFEHLSVIDSNSCTLFVKPYKGGLNMSKAEERAQNSGYGTDPLNRAEYTANEVRDAFIDGYEQAEQDLELTWEDLATIEKLVDDFFKQNHALMNDEEIYKEVLKRYKDYKERKKA